MWFLLTLSLTLWANESPTATIDQAQALAVKKNRKEACALLNRTLNALPAQARGRTKLIEALSQVSKVFFTDKGQKLFESGQVNLFENPDLALTQLREAERLEDENLLVLGHLARAQILKKDCDGALVSLAMARSLNPHAAEPAVLELQALLCAKRYDIFRDKFKLAQVNDKWDSAFVQYLSGQEQIRLNSTHKAFDTLSRVTEEYPQFPEAYYFLAQAGEALEKDPSPWLQKYSSLCKGLTLRDRKKYLYEPQLCSRMKEVDDELAAKKSEL